MQALFTPMPQPENSSHSTGLFFRFTPLANTAPVIHSTLIPCPRSAYIFQPSMALVLLTFDLSVRQSDWVCLLPPVSVCPCGLYLAPPAGRGYCHQGRAIVIAFSPALSEAEGAAHAAHVLKIRVLEIRDCFGFSPCCARRSRSDLVLRILSSLMSERVNCNILQPSTLARRSSVLTAEGRKTGKNRRRAAKSKDAPFTVNVSRKWHSAKNAVRGIFDVYKWLDEIPLARISHSL